VFGAGPQAHGHIATLGAALTPHRTLATVSHLVRDPRRVRPAEGFLLLLVSLVNVSEQLC
jgi:hypothetical protein